MTRIINLVNLAPGIQATILAGREPDGLTLKRLCNELPLDRKQQEVRACVVSVTSEGRVIPAACLLVLK